jgi:AcrR family transcriptional regulator
MNDPRPRIDRDARRDAILDVAADVFLEDGYAAASMSEIAARLGGSKGTLYNYFKSKEELFSAYVERHCIWHREAVNEMLEDTDLRNALARFGRTYLALILTDQSLRFFRLIAAEAERSPEVGRIFYESGPQKGAAMMGGYLGQMIERGVLRPTDPVTAAHQFIGLCQNRLWKARLCNVSPEPTEQEIGADVDAAVATFMTAFGAV